MFGLLFIFKITVHVSLSVLVPCVSVMSLGIRNYTWVLAVLFSLWIRKFMVRSDWSKCYRVLEIASPLSMSLSIIIMVLKHSSWFVFSIILCIFWSVFFLDASRFQLSTWVCVPLVEFVSTFSGFDVVSDHILLSVWGSICSAFSCMRLPNSWSLGESGIRWFINTSISYIPFFLV